MVSVAETKGTFKDIFEEKLMNKPFATNDLMQGLDRYRKDLAMQMRYIQYNNTNSFNWICLDIDYDFYQQWLWNYESYPAPNIAVINPNNNHAHLLYQLAVPVHRNKDSKQNPLLFLGAVERGLIGLWKSDPSYAGLICKNPLNPDWLSIYLRKEPYTLNELNQYLHTQGMERTFSDSELGRNCTLFNELRLWAYNEIRKRPEKDLWSELVFSKAKEINTGFSSPLGENEIKATAKSVASWVWQHLTEGKSMAWNKITQRKAAEARHKKMNAKVEAFSRLYRPNENSIADVCNLLGISMRTGMTYAKIIKQEQAKQGELNLEM